MRWFEAMMLVSFFGMHAAIGGEAYEELARLYDYPARLGHHAVPVCFNHGCSSVRRIALAARRLAAGDPAVRTTRRRRCGRA